MLYDWRIGSAGLGCIGIAGMLGWKNIFQVLKIRRVHTFARTWISGMIYAKMNRWQVFSRINPIISKWYFSDRHCMLKMPV